jgi:hypothetical protein
MMQRVNPYMQTNYRFINRPVVPCSRAKLYCPTMADSHQPNRPANHVIRSKKLNRIT